MDPSSDWDEGEHHLVYLGPSWAMGRTGSCCPLFGRNESYYGSRYATPKGAGVCDGRASPAPGEGAIIDVASIVVHCITRTTTANSCTWWVSLSRASG